MQVPPPQLTSIDVIASALEPVIPDLGRMSSPDGAVTLMLSDIDGAHEVAARVGPQRWEAILRDHNAMVRQLVGHHDGAVVKFEQDGFLATFNSAHGGLHCAVELQRAFASTPDVAGTADVALRVGLHSGFVIANPEQLLGRNVVLASRIAGRATGGEILVSSTLHDYTAQDASFEFSERGEFHFKGVLGEHTLYAVSWRG
jgi:class 3 adenylate cyclase